MTGNVGYMGVLVIMLMYLDAAFFNLFGRIFKNLFSHAEQISQVGCNINITWILFVFFNLQLSICFLFPPFVYSFF